MLDIYTKKPISVRSAEHLLLNSLGGRLESLDLIDKSTNDRLGATIDAGLADTLNFLRVMFDAKSGDGRSPPAVRGTQTSDGQRFDLLAGGKPQLAKPQLTFEKLADGTLKVSGHARSMEELHHLAARKFAELGIPSHVLESNAKVVEAPVPMIQHVMTTDPPAWRAMAKMLCNLLAVHDRAMFLSEPFDAVREFVLGGGDPWEFVAVNTQPVDVFSSQDALGVVDHLLVVHGDQATGTVRGLVVFFGHLQFIVNLAETLVTESFTTAYRVDSLGGRDRFNGSVDTMIRPPSFVRMGGEDMNPFWTAYREGMNRIMPIAINASTETARQNIITKSMDEAFGKPDGRPMTEEMIAKFAHLVSERYVALLQRAGHFKEET